MQCKNNGVSICKKIKGGGSLMIPYTQIISNVENEAIRTLEETRGELPGVERAFWCLVSTHT